MTLPRPVPDSQIDPRSPTSEDLFTRLRDSHNLAAATILGASALLMQGTVDTVVTTIITDLNPTSGSLVHDDQYNGMWIHFTGGAAFTANNRNRYKITDSTAVSGSIQSATDFAALGVLAGDTYEILGHVHDVNKLDMKDLLNVAENLDMTQTLVDAIFDPNTNRANVATKANPFATIDSLSVPTWVDNSTPAVDDFLEGANSFSVAGKVSAATWVPVGSVFVLIEVQFTQPSGFDGRAKFRQPDTGSYIGGGQCGNNADHTVTVLAPLNGIREFDRDSSLAGGSGINAHVIYTVIGYQ